MRFLFYRYPQLFFVFAAFFIANNYFHWSPTDVQKGVIRIALPAFCIGMGTILTYLKWRRKKAEAQDAQ